MTREIKKINICAGDIQRALEKIDYEFSCKFGSFIRKEIGNIKRPEIIIEPRKHVYVTYEETETL